MIQYVLSGNTQLMCACSSVDRAVGSGPACGGSTPLRRTIFFAPSRQPQDSFPADVGDAIPESGRTAARYGRPRPLLLMAGKTSGAGPGTRSDPSVLLHYLRADPLEFLAVLLQRLQLLAKGLSLLLVDSIDKKHAVQMVYLMLSNPRGEPAPFL